MRLTRQEGSCRSWGRVWGQDCRLASQQKADEDNDKNRRAESQGERQLQVQGLFQLSWEWGVQYELGLSRDSLR